MSAVLPPHGAHPFMPLRAPAPRPSAAAASAPLIRLSPPGEAARPPIGSRRGTGIAVVVGLHVLVGWALASGLAKEAVQLVKKPIEMAVITEAPPPPPPPPPPKIEQLKEIPKLEAPPPPAYVPPPEVVPVAPPPAPVIQAVQAEPPPKPVEIAPPPPAPEPPKPVAVKQEISLACPGYQNVLASMLEEAIDRVGVEGTVRTLLKVRGNQVVEVMPQSGPQAYYKYLQSAAKRMKCSAGGADEVLVSLDVQFKR